MALLIESVDVGNTTIKVKFLKTIKVSSIVNANFRLYSPDATPANVADPFEAITVSEDYNSISRTLTLYLKSQLVGNRDYEFWVQGLLDATGTLFSDDTDTSSPAGVQHGAEFTTPASTIPTATDPLPPAPIPVEIEDHSVKASVFIASDSLVAPNPDFYVVSTDPEDSIVDTDHANGRVTIKFSSMPLVEFVNTTYFKVQRKSMSRGFTRWETVTTQVNPHLTEPWVTVDFPLIEAATPTAYFEEGYKYRVRVLKEVAGSEGSVSGGEAAGSILDLILEEGATFSRLVTYLNANGSARDLTGHTAKMHVRSSYASTTVLLQLLTSEATPLAGVSQGTITINGPAGTLLLEVSAEVTALLTVGDAVYDLELTDPTGATPVVTRLLQGRFTITPEVTQ